MKKNNIRTGIGAAEEKLAEKVNSTVTHRARTIFRKRPRLKALARVVNEFADDMSRDNVGLYAAQSVFFSILSAVPCMILVLMCIKYFVNIDMNVVSDAVQKAFPDPPSSYIIRIISEVFYRSDSTAQFSIAIIAVLWSASRGTMAIYSGLNNMFGYTKSDNWFAARIASYFYTLLIVMVVAATIIILIFGNSILMHIDTEVALPTYMLKILFSMKYPIFFVMFIFAFASLYKFLPQRRLSYRSQLPGAVFTAVGWICFSYCFSIYVRYFSSYSVIYGSLTAIILLMLWLYFCMYMLLIGAEINKHISNGYFRKLFNIIFKKIY